MTASDYILMPFELGNGKMCSVILIGSQNNTEMKNRHRMGIKLKMDTWVLVLTFTA